tara:strand:+ start:9555 stop:12863 length:3309 start_codon:yes stop_codon:yes gene_type:complete
MSGSNSCYSWTVNNTTGYNADERDLRCIKNAFDYWESIINDNMLSGTQKISVDVGFERMTDNQGNPNTGTLAYAGPRTWAPVDENGNGLYERSKSFVTSGEVTINIQTRTDGQLVNQASTESVYTSIVIHEIGHIMFLVGIVINNTEETPVATYIDPNDNRRKIYWDGVNATRYYRRYFNNNNFVGVPIEDMDGPNNVSVNGQTESIYINYHWEEGYGGSRVINGITHPGLDGELMTPYANGSLAFSAITIGFLQDAGYKYVNYFKGDSYNGVSIPQVLNATTYYVRLNPSGSFTDPYYVFSTTPNGNALNSASQDLTLEKGKAYIFERTDSGHPFNIGTGYKQNTSDIVFDSTGTSNFVNGVASIVNGERLSFIIPEDLQVPLVYYCTQHNNMIKEFDIADTAPNQPPTVSNVSISTNEDVNKTVSLNAYASDPEGFALSYAIITSPTIGTASLNGNLLTYSPNSNVSGSDSITIRATDNSNLSATFTISITVRSVNDAPTSSNGAFTTNEDVTKNVNLNVYTNDIDTSTLSYSLNNTPTLGTVTITQNILSYSPKENVSGTENIGITASDGSSNTSFTLVATIVPVNDRPVANDVTVSTNEDQVKTMDLNNYVSDVENTPLNYSIVGNPELGSAVLNNNILSYTPNLNVNGNDSIDIRASDGELDITFTINITIVPVNDSPVANSGSLTVKEDSVTEVELSDYVNDIDNDTLVYSVVTSPVYGEVSINASVLTYTVNKNYIGNDSIVLSVSDGTVSSEFTLNFTITRLYDLTTVFRQDYQNTNGDVLDQLILTNSGSNFNPEEYKNFWNHTETPVVENNTGATIDWVQGTIVRDTRLDTANAYEAKKIAASYAELKGFDVFTIDKNYTTGAIINDRKRGVCLCGVSHDKGPFSMDNLTETTITDRIIVIKRSVGNQFKNTLNEETNLVYFSNKKEAVFGSQEIPCFDKSTKILCKVGDSDQYVSICKLKEGDLVKTYKHGYRAIQKIKTSTQMFNMGGDYKHSMFRMVQKGDMIDDLLVTGRHGILLNDLSSHITKSSRNKPSLRMIDDKCLLTAAYCNQFIPETDVKEYTIYHLALQGEQRRYGIYANGVLMETWDNKC